jgi:hypothetical protein
MRVYAYSEARWNLASLLDQADEEGEVRIKRKDRQIYVIKPQPRSVSPLDVPGVDINIDTAEIVSLIRESRERSDRRKHTPSAE